jgi:hypothetical protein
VKEAESWFAIGYACGFVDGGGDDEATLDEREIEGRANEVKRGLARRGMDGADGEVAFEMERSGGIAKGRTGRYTRRRAIGWLRCRG